MLFNQHQQGKILTVTFFFFLFSFSLVSAVGIDNPNLPLIRTTVLDTNISIHSASNWDTNIGNLSYVDANQFDNIINKLTIDTAWLTSFGSGIWCALTGCTMEGDIDMDGNNITNADWVIADVGNFTDLYVSNNSIYISTEYMKLNPVDTAPETCDATMLGAIYFDISEDDICTCKSAGWFVMTDGSPCT